MLHARHNLPSSHLWINPVNNESEIVCIYSLFKFSVVMIVARLVGISPNRPKTRLSDYVALRNRLDQITIGE